jgi:hypothetical protein
MAEQICRQCEKLLQTGDVVIAEIETHFVALKSKVTYALEKPYECHWVRHKNCQWPQGLPENE